MTSAILASMFQSPSIFWIVHLFDSFLGKITHCDPEMNLTFMLVMTPKSNQKITDLFIPSSPGSHPRVSSPAFDYERLDLLERPRIQIGKTKARNQ